MRKTVTILLICAPILFYNFFILNNLDIITTNFPRSEKNYLPVPSSDQDSWYQTWGGKGKEWAHDMEVDSLRNIYLVGYTSSFGKGGGDSIIVKYHSSGNIRIWNRSWGGSGNEEAHAIVLDSSENIYITGYTEYSGEYDIFLLKYNSSGHLQWNLTWSEDGAYMGWDLSLDSSENIYIAGDRYINNQKDAYVVKFDNAGNYLWNYTWGSEFTSECSTAIIIDSLDRIYLTISKPPYELFNILEDIYLVRLDNAGNLDWSLQWGTPGHLDMAYDLTLDSAGNILITGLSSSIGEGGLDMLLLKFNNSGFPLFNTSWGSSNTDIAYDIETDSSDDIYITGSIEYSDRRKDDVVLLKFDSSGKLEMYKTWGGYDIEYAHCLTIDSSDNIYIAGGTFSYGNGVSDMFLIKNLHLLRSSSIKAIPGFRFIVISSIIILTYLILMELTRKKMRLKN